VKPFKTDARRNAQTAHSGRTVKLKRNIEVKSPEFANRQAVFAEQFKHFVFGFKRIVRAVTVNRGT
jgi:hypothetical protein